MAPAAAKTETPPPPAPVTTPLAARNSRPQDPPSKAVPALGGFFVQVEAFSANDIAAKEVTKLQGKGYPAFVFTEAENTPGPRYKVRVGPYSARAQADQMRKSLIKEGYHPLIKR
jgi:cell division septation protein DedD